MVCNILKSEKVRFVSRTVIALLLIPLFAPYIYCAGVLVAPISLLPASLFNETTKLHNLIYSCGIFTMFVVIPPFIGTYLYLKLLGVLKKSDKLTFLSAFLIVTLCSVLGYIWFHILDSENTFLYKTEVAVFIPIFFLHKFFNFLTKKFPTPFEKIGYYTSIEFVKDLLKEIKL